MSELWNTILGLHVSAQDLTWTQIAARTVVVFVAGLILVRLADRRFLGRNAGFDVLLAFVLGSVLSRAINGQAPFFKTIGAAALLVALHRVVGMAAARWSAFSRLLKGDALVLVRDGKPLARSMRQGDISNEDLEESLRLNANLTRAEDAKEARLERSGQISVLKKAKSDGAD